MDTHSEIIDMPFAFHPQVEMEIRAMLNRADSIADATADNLGTKKASAEILRLVLALPTKLAEAARAEAEKKRPVDEGPVPSSARDWSQSEKGQ